MRRLLSLILLLAATAEAAPQRLVSLNLCTDQLMLMLAPRQHILMLSQLASDPGLSFMAARAEGIPAFDGTVESVLSLAPDLVLAAPHSAGPAVQLLRRVGVRVAVLDMPESIDGTRAFIRRSAQLLGRQSRGEELIRDMDRRLHSVRRRGDGRALRTLIYLPNGVSPGSGTLKGELLSIAGMGNLAAESGIAGYGELPLEAVLHNRPDLILFDAAELQTPSLARRLLSHPALAGVGSVLGEVPTATWICPGPMIAEAAEILLAMATAAN